ncbi:MAG: DUF3347 domain-containing protein [Verrucomicrobia bacterium]|nr:DUF3347 domain-containing protein [Verrucomicrobiota bacterium]MDA1067128.1 DUF3347 domain-containing protein [Verrucomicrobiota bacterium]
MVNLSAETANSGSRLDKHVKTLDATIIDQYEAVTEGLVQDNLDTAKNASSKLAASARDAGNPSIANTASKVAVAKSLEDARGAFRNLSSQVIKLSQGNSDYTVMTCPMVENGRWLQSDDKVSNPYMGQKMPGCGMPES